jgi:hypothetical protein
MRRRVRLRTTARPTLRDAMIPTRGFSAESDAAATAKEIESPRHVVPSFRTRSNSAVRVSRRVLGNEKSVGTLQHQTRRGENSTSEEHTRLGRWLAASRSNGLRFILVAAIDLNRHGRSVSGRYLLLQRHQATLTVGRKFRDRETRSPTAETTTLPRT